MNIKDKIRSRAEFQRGLRKKAKEQAPISDNAQAMEDHIRNKLKEREQDQGVHHITSKERLLRTLTDAQKSLLLGDTDTGKSVYIPPDIRKTHMHVIGASGRGKSKFIEGLVRQDIISGDGLCLVDPHGYLFNDLVTWCAEQGFLDRRSPKNIILFDPSVSDWSFGFNPLPTELKDLSFTVESMIKGFVKVWGADNTEQTPQLERCLRSIFYILAERRLSILEATKLVKILDGSVRNILTSGLKYTPELVRDDWEFFKSQNPKDFENKFLSTLNRLGRFVNDPTITNILGQVNKVLDVRKVMNERATLLINLGTSARPEDNRVTSENMELLGTLIINEFLNRAKERPKHSEPFYLYIDECSLFLNQDIERILVECRKFGLHLILAHQTLGQLRDEKLGGSEALYQGVMGGAQTKVVFGGLPADEAEPMANEIFFNEFDLKHVKSTKPSVVGYEKILLQSHSRGSTITDSQSRSSAIGSSTAQGSSQVETTFSDNPDSTALAKGVSSQSAFSDISSSGSGTAISDSEVHTEGEALKPILKDLPDNYYTLEEERHMAARFLKAQRTQYAIIKIPEGRPVKLKTPTIPEGYATPKDIDAFKLKSYELTFFATRRPLIEAEITERHRLLEDRSKKENELKEPDSYIEDDLSGDETAPAPQDPAGKSHKTKAKGKDIWSGL